MFTAEKAIKSVTKLLFQSACGQQTLWRSSI